MNNDTNQAAAYDKSMILDLVRALDTLSDEELEPIADAILNVVERIKGIKRKKP
jgi:hypothetical protein